MRLDIQCLRGIAIILVLLFHLFPNLFVNGFLGVDIFFVISGFLMAKNLTRTGLKSLKDFGLFYYRRFRRILPLYYFIVLLTVIMVHLYLGDYLWDSNNRYSLASLFLVTNQLVIHDQGDYFNEFLTTSISINAFLHLWSLSLEMQFYLIVPFIFFALQILKHDYLKLIAVSLITLIGYIAHLLFAEQFAFNFMPLRLWQFSSGFIAMFWSKIDKADGTKTDNTKDTKIKNPFSKDDLMTISLITIGVCILPIDVNKFYLRPLVTMATAAIIACESQNSMILSSKLLGYIGDISYVMYLVHWPPIAIFAPYTVKSYIFLSLNILFTSIVLHQIFEQKYLKLNWKALITFLFALILANALLQYDVRNRSNFWKLNYSPEVQEIIDANKAQLPWSWVAEPKKEECVEEPLTDVHAESNFGYGSCVRGNGSLSIMVIGNSYVLSFRNPIREQFNYNYSTFRYSSIGESYVIYADLPDAWVNLNNSKINVARHKPDVLFVMARYPESLREPIQENDPYVQQINENIKYYEQFVKKMYIMDSHPLYKWNFMNSFLQSVPSRPDDLESFHLNRREADKVMKNVKKRFSMVKCSKCEFVDFSHVFVDGDKYLTFDPDQILSYVDNTIHLTTEGLRLCAPVLKRLAMDAMNTVK